jgi:tetratricopeptide (TPR) repeat protein
MQHLAAAAQRALNRGDRLAQVNLLSRTLALLPVAGESRAELLAELGYALTESGEFARAEAVLAEATEAARDASDGRVEARARIALAELRYATEPGGVAAQRREAERAIRVFEEAGDDHGLGRAWRLLAFRHWEVGEGAAAQDAHERSTEYFRRAGNRREELVGLAWLASVAFWGPMPGPDARRHCEQILEQVEGDLIAETEVRATLGQFMAIEGRFDEARALESRRAALYEELGLKQIAAWLSQNGGWLEILAGDAEAAERILRAGYDTLEQLGAKTDLVVVGYYLARALCMQGQYDETERLTLSIEEWDPTAPVEVATARGTRAKAVARLGRTDEGERLAREAVALIDRTDFPIDRADARMDLADVLLLAGRPDEAAQVLEEALQLHKQKGNLVSAERTRVQLAELGR